MPSQLFPDNVRAAVNLALQVLGVDRRHTVISAAAIAEDLLATHGDRTLDAFVVTPDEFRALVERHSRPRRVMCTTHGARPHDSSDSCVDPHELGPVGRCPQVGHPLTVTD